MKMKIEFEVGTTAHMQPVVLVAKPQDKGGYRYDLVKQAINQRDDTVVLFDLTDETLAAIGAAYLRMKELQK